MFLLSAVSVVVYVHLDCLDGKQARRTKSSSPLGQLFDHGCDALSVNLLLANIAVSTSMPCSWAHAIGNFGVMFTWILAQWEEYHTSIMLYGNSYYGVLEANYCIAALHLVTFFAGPALWRTPATKVFPFEALEGVREWRLGGRRAHGLPCRVASASSWRAARRAAAWCDALQPAAALW